MPKPTQDLYSKTPAEPGPALNPAQKAAVLAPHSPLLIVAGAGTGKTKTLTSRIIHLMQSGMPPERICSITFTNKAAKEMAKRVRDGYPVLKTIKNFEKEPFLGTFHSLGARMLRKECRSVGRTPNFTIFDDHDSFDLVKKAVKIVIPPKKDDDGDDGFLASAAKKNKKDTPVYFAKKISELKNLGELLPEMRPSAEKDAQVRRVFDLYESSLERNNAFDFDDLIEKTVKILREHPEVLKKYQHLYDAILVDEYQDINPKQYELVTLLASDHRNLSVVGDDEQTIYSWRYANIRTFLNFDKDWEGAQVHFLEENYRSTGNIIRAASAVAKNNRFRTPKNLWTSNPDGSLITLFEAWGENEEAEWIAGQIQTIRHKDKNADIGILYRTNAQSRAIEQSLIRNNVPYRIFGGLKFYERREIKDAVAALRYISNSKDEPAKERLEKNLTKRKFAEFRDRIREIQDPGKLKVEKLDPITAMKLFLEIFGYYEYLESNFVNSDEREENIAELITFASGFESLDELLERLSLLQAADDIGGKPIEGREVNLMTVHLAKGLEFDSVFIAGVAEGFLPHGRSLDDENSLEEERRLMYVAMTRARKDLYLSFYGVPSRFINEIPPESIKLVMSDGSSTSGGSNWYGDKDDDVPEENVVQWD